jgi:RNA polymerase sigma factor for flagellar operon FliA
MHEARILECLPLVRTIAWTVRKRIPFGDINDLIQMGMVGLCEASETYHEVPGASFRTYASRRIHGAILDELRRLDPVTRYSRGGVDTLNETRRALQQELGREPLMSEIAGRMGVSIDACHEIASREFFRKPVYYEDLNGEGDDFLSAYAAKEDDAPERLIKLEKIQALVRHIEALPERDQAILDFYYGRDMDMKSIGELYGISESRVCQLHKGILGKLKDELREFA